MLDGSSHVFVSMPRAMLLFGSILADARSVMPFALTCCLVAWHLAQMFVAFVSVTTSSPASIGFQPYARGGIACFLLSGFCVPARIGSNRPSLLSLRS